jgi:hypothetical protein
MSRKRKFVMRVGYIFSYKLFGKIASKPANTNYFDRVKILRLYVAVIFDIDTKTAYTHK